MHLSFVLGRVNLLKTLSLFMQTPMGHFKPAWQAIVKFQQQRTERQDLMVKCQPQQGVATIVCKLETSLELYV